MDIGQRLDYVLMAQAAYLSLNREIDNLYTVISFYLERYPLSDSPSDLRRAAELESCIVEISNLIGMLAEVVTHWVLGKNRLLSRGGVELNILNEIWANMQALIYFLTSHDISLDPFDADKAYDFMHTLTRCNRSL